MSTRLDHVALATTDVTEPLRVLVGELGGTVLAGGHSIGFRPMQVHMGDATAGMKIELLEPHEPERNDFLARFVARHGDGPHHLTFKVDDIRATLDQVTAGGLQPVSVDLSDPVWQEAFLMPREAHGTVVQLAQSSLARSSPYEEYTYVVEHGVDGAPIWWPAPPPRAETTTYLERVVLAVPSIDDALGLYGGLLDGTVEARDDDTCALAWPGGGRLLLERRDDRGAGIDRLELSGASGQTVTVAGARLVVAAREGAPQS